MRTTRLIRQQSGFEAVTILVVVAIVGIVGFAGYKVTQHRSDNVATNVSTGKTVAPASIKTQADLSAAAKSLDNASTQVDSGVNGNALDSDINDLL